MPEHVGNGFWNEMPSWCGDDAVEVVVDIDVPGRGLG